MVLVVEVGRSRVVKVHASIQRDEHFDIVDWEEARLAMYLAVEPVFVFYYFKHLLIK